MVRDKQGGFKFESARTPHMAGFFLWLETIQPTLGSQIIHEILMTFIGPGRNSAPFVPPEPQRAQARPKSQAGPPQKKGAARQQKPRASPAPAPADDDAVPAKVSRKRRRRTRKKTTPAQPVPAAPLASVPAQNNPS